MPESRSAVEGEPVSDCTARLIREHRDTEVLLARLADAVGSGAEPEKLAGLYRQLADELTAHYAREEQALFPVLSQYRSMMLLEVEHDDLLALQQAFAEALAAQAETGKPHPELRERLERFREHLAAHIYEEEDKIFPLAEASLLPEEKQLVQRRYRELDSVAAPALVRPKPGYRIVETGLFGPGNKPIAYSTLYEREHAQVQHLWLESGRQLARHWAGQHQCLIVASGRVEFRTDESAHILEAGGQVTIDSRLPFSLSALADSHLLLFKIWPHPHFTKV